MSTVHALFQSGTDLDCDPGTPRKDALGGVPAIQPANDVPAIDAAAEICAPDFFIERDGVRYAGTHLIVDLWEATGLDDLALVEATLRDCVEAAGATLLHIHLHHFTPNHGISGVAVLAESHISIHTWPENGYAALDVFMCGAAEPHKAIEVLRKAFKAKRLAVEELLRGRAP